MFGLGEIAYKPPEKKEDKLKVWAKKTLRRLSFKKEQKEEEKKEEEKEKIDHLLGVSFMKSSDEQILILKAFDSNKIILYDENEREIDRISEIGEIDSFVCCENYVMAICEKRRLNIFEVRDEHFVRLERTIVRYLGNNPKISTFCKKTESKFSFEAELIICRVAIFSNSNKIVCESILERGGSIIITAPNTVYCCAFVHMEQKIMLWVGSEGYVWIFDVTNGHKFRDNYNLHEPCKKISLREGAKATCLLQLKTVVLIGVKCKDDEGMLMKIQINE